MLRTSSLPYLLTLTLFASPIAQAQSLTREPEASAEAALAHVGEVAAPLLGHTDSVARLGGAMAVCALAVGDPDAAKALLTQGGWLVQPAESGESIFADTGDGVSFVAITDAGGECSVVTTALGTADAQKNYFDMTNAIGWPPFDWTDDGNMGCMTAPMDAQLTAEITAANGDCTSAQDAMVTFTTGEP